MESNAEPFEVFEDDFLPNPYFQIQVQKGTVPDHLDLSKPQGKVWFGHAYRMSRELSYDRDAPLRLMEVAQALLAASALLPKALVKECVLLSIEEVKSGRPGIPTVRVDDPEKLAEWRARILAEDESEKTVKH